MRTPSSGAPTTFVYDAAGQLAAEYATTAVASPCGSTCYLTVDHLGSTRMVTNAAMGAVERVDFMPYGEEAGFGSGSIQASVAGYGSYVAGDVRQRFTGKERDAETGLDYFGARYFSAAQGRWTSPDWSASPVPVPYADLGDPQTLNLYGYVRNNPLGKADADGHTWRDSLDFLTGVVRGAAASVTWGYVGSPKASDTLANRSGQAVGTAIAAHVGADAVVGGTGTAIATSPTGVGIVVGGGVAAIGASTAAGAAKNSAAILTTPLVVVSPGDDAIPVPAGASGPSPVVNGSGNVTGHQYQGGSGGEGMSPNTTGVRVMDPTPPRGASPGYPNGYVSYNNSASPKPQTVNPQTGKTVPKSDPTAHIPLNP